MAYHIVTSAAPAGIAIMTIAGADLIANLVGTGLLLQFPHEDINMRAVWLCTRDDAGTIAASGLILLLASKWPDLIIGTALAALLISRSIGLIGSTRRELRDQGKRAISSG